MRCPVRTVVLVVVLAASLILPGRTDAAEWQTFENCRLTEHTANDADSFHVQAGDRRILVRLYFIDCPETSAGTDADAKRVREQARHFGIVDMARVLHHGKEARKLVADVLAEPFTVHTAFATALGRSATPRVYGMITTAGGEDLGTLLVKKGLARAHGVRRETPDGTSAEEMAKRLEDLELQAVMRRAGIWSETDPEMIAQLRAEQRGEDAGMKELRSQLRGAPSGPIDINTATAGELQSISGIGPVLASRIIEGRPYKTVDDLKRVRGINTALLERLRPQLTVAGSSGREETEPK